MRLAVPAVSASSAWVGRAGAVDAVRTPTMGGRPYVVAAEPPVSRLAGVRYSVTVIGTNIAGQLTSWQYDQVFLFNADGSARFDSLNTSIQGFAP